MSHHRPGPMPLAALVQAVLGSRGFAHKQDISEVVGTLARALPDGLAGTTLATREGVLLGDDCAAIPDGDGYLLLAIEGLVEDFVERMPWFAGYSGLMVNLSDIAAMGGRPMAVVDALWSRDHAEAAPVLQGLADASQAYGVPIVGGHSNNRAARGQLAVAVLGRAKALLSSFAARPGQHLMMAADLRGQWQDPYPFWNASTHAPAQRLRNDLALLPELAEAGLCACAKDISMAGVLGTALMLLECSKVGARIDLSAIPHPPGHGPHDGAAAWLRWLEAFPSFGYLFSVEAMDTAAVAHHFKHRGIACQVIGEVTEGHEVWLSQAVDASLKPSPEHALLWDFTQRAFIGAPVATDLTMA